MRSNIIEQTELWHIESHGNGIAYTFTYKPTMDSGFVQGDDATQWLKEYAAMAKAYAEHESVWHDKTWNACLAELCSEYIQELPSELEYSREFGNRV